MTRNSKVLFAPIAVSFILIAGGVLPGCGAQDNLVAPNATAPSVADLSPGAPSLGVNPLGGRPTAVASGVAWQLVASGWVIPTQPAKIQGSRYALKFLTGSVAMGEDITIRERDPMIADVRFGPHGTRFLVPVQVTIDYRGTANDPESANYNGAEPKVFWYDPSAGAWQEIPCTADKKLKSVTFQVEHFSRYAMSDGAEDGEWQWTRTGKQTDGLEGDDTR